MFYDYRTDVYELVEDGRLVNVLNGRFFTVEQVENVLEIATPVQDVAEFFRDKIEKVERHKSTLEKYLQYADGGAYYQDKKRIAECRDEIASIKRFLGDA